MNRSEKLANDLRDFINKNKLIDTRVYFNGMCYHWNSNGEMSTIDDIMPSDYFEYANDETVSMSFEGLLYEIVNGYCYPDVLRKFDKIFEKHKCYYEFGHAWNLTVYFD